MGLIEITKPNTQTCIVVYMTHETKKEIREKCDGCSMSRYFLDLHEAEKERTYELNRSD